MWCLHTLGALERSGRRKHQEPVLEVTTVSARKDSRLSRSNDPRIGLLNRIQIDFVKSVQSWVMKRLNHIKKACVQSGGQRGEHSAHWRVQISTRRFWLHA